MTNLKLPFEDVAFEVSELHNIPLLPLRNTLLLPDALMPVNISRASSQAIVQKIMERRQAYDEYRDQQPAKVKNSAKMRAAEHQALLDTVIFVAAQRDPNTENPTLEEIYPVGTIAQILYVTNNEDAQSEITVYLHGLQRAEATAVFLPKEGDTSVPYSLVQVNDRRDTEPKMPIADYNDIKTKLYNRCREMIQFFPEQMSDEMSKDLPISASLLTILNFWLFHIPFALEEKYDIYQTDDIVARIAKLLALFEEKKDVLRLKMAVHLRTKMELDKQQRDYFLQHEIKNLQDLMGESEDEELEQLRQRGNNMPWNAKVAEHFEKEMHKLERSAPASPDYSVQLNYIETMLNLPWETYTSDKFNLKHARRILDRDHYGLDRVKERIIEYLAVLKLRNDMKSPILCLYGPPGVGKTSLGKSIAATLGRKYVRMSLGGMHDEAEIRGHRRTYIGAMPGRILQNLTKAQTSNPVFVLDEIDKIGADYKGDPSSALLEVLDPEQNNAFHDNFLDVDYDLSKVLFIATANSLSTISQPLLDRMELIEVNGYIIEEKIEIAVRHLIPKQLKEHGLDKKALKFTPTAIRKIIENYTSESGVRELDREIAKMIRKTAVKIASNEPYERTITEKLVREYLGVERFEHEKYDGSYKGVATGLAWTSVGGEILSIETTVNEAKGGKLTLTGNLGDVMKESAQLALEYIKANSNLFGITAEFIENHSLHLHVPEGAIPKDGPSAGIAILTAMVSALTGQNVQKRYAMTGEITLRGKVLPVGGLREKTLAAKRAGITDIILCADNRKDIEEIQPEYLKDITFHYVKEMPEVTKLALEA